MLMGEAGLESTVVAFEGARIPVPADAASARTPALANLSRYYGEARRFAQPAAARRDEGGRQSGRTRGGW